MIRDYIGLFVSFGVTVLLVGVTIYSFNICGYGVDGEYREGYIFDYIDKVDVYDSCGGPGDCQTIIQFRNRGRTHFIYPCDYALSLKNDTIYGIFYKSVPVEYAISRTGFENSAYYSETIYKITSSIGEILWKS